jgi:protein-glutamine gamma-glutamyltransferase
VALAGVWWRRREVFDVLAIAGFRLFPSRSWAGSVRRAVWLLEQRGRWAGRPRSRSQTQSHWLRLALATDMNAPASLQQLTMMAEWSAYASDLSPPWSGQEVRETCHRALDEWTLRRWLAGTKEDVRA